MNATVYRGPSGQRGAGACHRGGLVVGRLDSQAHQSQESESPSSAENWQQTKLEKVAEATLDALLWAGGATAAIAGLMTLLAGCATTEAGRTREELAFCLIKAQLHCAVAVEKACDLRPAPQSETNQVLAWVACATLTEGACMMPQYEACTAASSDKDKTQ